MNVIILGSGGCVSTPRARGNTIVGDILKAGFILNEDNPLRKELFTLDEIDTIRNQYRIKEVIITHKAFQSIYQFPYVLCYTLM